MKKVLFAFLIAGLISTVCFGEVLTTALPIGAEKLAIEGYYSSTNYKIADSSLSQFGPRIVYGITEDFDIIGKLGMGSIAGVSITTLGGGLKYTFLKVAAKDPIDLAGTVNFESASAKDFSTGTTSCGIIISKYLKNNFTLYGLVNVLMLSAKATGAPSTSGTGLQFGGGIKYQVTRKFSFMGELSVYNVESESYTNFALGIRYIM